MRVLVIGLNYDPEPTGIAPYTSALCRGLVQRGHQVRVITAMPHYPQWRIPAEYRGWHRRDVVDGIPVVRVRHYVPAHPTKLRRLLSECSFGIRVALARWGAPDVVVFVSPALFASAVAIFGRSPTQPFVTWVQDLYSLGLAETRGDHGVVARVAQVLESTVLRRSTGVGVIHPRFARVVEGLGVDRSRVRVIRNWTHLVDPPVRSRAVLRQRLGWAENLVHVVHAGAMGKKQDLMNVVGAGRLAAERDDPVRFVLMGAGSEMDRLKEASADLPTVEFLGPQPKEEFQGVLAAADLLLVNEHAGLREMAVPSKLTSYFASGRPVIAATSAASITAEEIEASGGGVRVDPADPERLLQAVLDLGADPSAADRIGMRGLEYRHATLSEDTAMDGFAEWLEGLALVHARRSPFVRIRDGGARMLGKGRRPRTTGRPRRRSPRAGAAPERGE